MKIKDMFKTSVDVSKMMTKIIAFDVTMLFIFFLVFYYAFPINQLFIMFVYTIFLLGVGSIGYFKLLLDNNALIWELNNQSEKVDYLWDRVMKKKRGEK